MLTTVKEEGLEGGDPFPPYVDSSDLPVQVDSPGGKKAVPKSFAEIQALLQAGKKREVKFILREGTWPANSKIRQQLWPLLCHQHVQGKTTQDAGFYWELVNQLFGTTGIISFYKCLYVQF